MNVSAIPSHKITDELNSARATERWLFNLHGERRKREREKEGKPNLGVNAEDERNI